MKVGHRVEHRKSGDSEQKSDGIEFSARAERVPKREQRTHRDHEARDRADLAAAGARRHGGGRLIPRGRGKRNRPTLWCCGHCLLNLRTRNPDFSVADWRSVHIHRIVMTKRWSGRYDGTPYRWDSRRRTNVFVAFTLRDCGRADAEKMRGVGAQDFRDRARLPEWIDCVEGER